VSAQGGTAGPSTSHMIVVARAKSPAGPWENMPSNPLLRTRDRAERWWSQGHGTILEAADGTWWVVYHAFENGYRTLGRQTLLMPIEWTADGTGLYVHEPFGVPRNVYRVDLKTGSRSLWHEIAPVDRSGVLPNLEVLVTPDGRSYATIFFRMLSSLFLVEGLR
jgi:hypothetical protein